MRWKKDDNKNKVFSLTTLKYWSFDLAISSHNWNRYRTCTHKSQIVLINCRFFIESCTVQEKPTIRLKSFLHRMDNVCRFDSFQIQCNHYFSSVWESMRWTQKHCGRLNIRWCQGKQMAPVVWSSERAEDTSTYLHGSYSRKHPKLKKREEFDPTVKTDRKSVTDVYALSPACYTTMK